MCICYTYSTAQDHQQMDDDIQWATEFLAWRPDEICCFALFKRSECFKSCSI